jgi:LysM repeat protein
MKVWDEILGQFVDPVDEATPKFVNAYFPWNEELAKAAKIDVPHYDPVKEKQSKAAAFEYSIEIACAQDELNTYQVGVFSLGKTKEDVHISTWHKTQNEKGFTLLTASVNVDEPKTLSREFFISSGSAMVFNEVNPIKQGVAHATESFIPIKPSVQVGKRLGWPTKGYFYHFIDNVLTHEYKLMGDGKWAFQVTQSTKYHLSDELISAHQYGFILLPWKINNTVVARQHLLYLPQKMTTQQLEKLTANWLDDNACLLDVDAIVQTKEEEKFAREKRNDDQTTYVIQSGDTLSGIANHQGLTLSELIELNPQYKEKEDYIQVGDTLIIEEIKVQTTTSVHTVKLTPGTGQRETWGEIAVQYGLSAKALLNLNPMYEQDPTSLKIGDSLLVNKEDPQQAITTPRETLPPHKIQDVGKSVSFANAYTTQVKRELRHGVIAVLKDSCIPQRTPILNVCKVDATAKATEFGDMAVLALPASSATGGSVLGSLSSNVSKSIGSWVLSDVALSGIARLGGGLIAALWPSQLGDSSLNGSLQFDTLDAINTTVRFNLYKDENGIEQIVGIHSGDGYAYGERVKKKVAVQDGDKFVIDLEEGITLTWVPDGEEYKLNPSTERPEYDSLDVHDIWVRPIEEHDQELGTVLYPEDELVEYIVTFPADAGLPPLYLVFSKKAYSAGFKTKLSPNSYPGVSRARHFQEANENLLNKMETDADFKKQMALLDINLTRTVTGLAPRRPPEGWTWHHERGEGEMVLVPRSHHTIGSDEWKILHPENKGGYSIWGKK